ncbi:tetratricopeptide repeat protein [Massilia yuzhufengensis]|uniref:Tetratricopeptide repeat-containing protein n=1 Tax=Massilia yuzhufengensis TaxID=1164594 RepID=A0A1I1UBW5_9BURK|nr:tetratricopeptide repeat protein [Massilia yuzhufengensis]SFD68115.1 Tetratricopeptide repeat-containing protein [Massilia yuzhufengensis]
MKTLPILAAVGAVALAAIAATAFALAPPAPGTPQAAAPAFDPLLAAGAVCSPPRAGRPPLLDRLVLAQAETAPFKPGQQLPAAAASATPPLYANLGELHVPVTTANRRAQAYFDQGMRLTFSFNHAEAARAFRAAQGLDPHCAMCHWGEALVLGPNINAPMFPEAAAPAAAAAAKAVALAGKASPPEQALIRAVARRYQATPPADRAPLDRAYADAMMDAARAFPNNDTIQVLYAESLMDLSPWDYWQAGGAEPKNRTADMLAALERVLERNPSHPGAAHYYIHAVEASTHPERALPSARLLARQIPGAGHIVHMPSHIYYRLGMYREALQSNRDAIAIDEQYFGGSPSDPVYKGAYYPHNIHFVMVSALMGGDGRTALEAAGKLDQSVPAELLKGFPSLQPVKAAPYFSHVQFSSPDVLLQLPDPGPDFVLVKAMWHYARAVGHARKGMLAEAGQEVAALDRIERTADFKPIADAGIPAREIVQTARAVARGRLADARNKLPDAIAAYREAIAVQDKLPYMEPPYWYYPVRQSLGAALLRTGQLDAAEQVFRDSLARTPSNGWALRGLIEVYQKRGDAPALAAAQKRFETTWLGERGGPALARL